MHIVFLDISLLKEIKLKIEKLEIQRLHRLKRLLVHVFSFMGS